MSTFYGLKLIDLVAIVGYFAVVMVVGFWASRRVKDEDDFFLGGRSFGKGLLVMHWLCTGTHSEQAVQVSGATARVGLGGIWYQWMYLFSTPFYWMIGVCTSLPTTPHFVVGRSACRVGVGPSLNRSWAQRSRPVVQAGRRAFPGDESVVD